MQTVLSHFPMTQRISFTVVVFLVLVFSASAQDTVARNRKLEQRAAEIEKMLPTTPHCVGNSTTNRDAWNAIAKSSAFRNVVRDAENVIAAPIPELPESLYMDFYQTGNRTRYQKVHGQKYSRIATLVLGECLENKGRFIAPLEETVRSICADPSWLLPAHDRNGDVYKGTSTYADLVSTNTSVELGLAVSWLGEKLSPEIRKLIRDNVERRMFAPYEACVKEGKTQGMWWVTGTNNWNSVCHAGTVGAALTLIDSPRRRAWYIAAAEHFMGDFFRGFTPDGYCSEGMGYWNYGYGNFVDLAEMAFQTTNGGVDFFAMPLVKNCALFGARMEVAPGQFAAFADCSITSKPNSVLVAFLSRRLGLGLTEYEKATSGPGSLKSVGVYCFPNSAAKVPAAATAAPILGELRTEFVDAGILICRPKPGTADRLAFVCKGGHNAEHHNHNDVGSFTVMLGGKMPILDPGGEVYTQRTFSNKRYDSKLLNSFGHPVPVVNGQLQKTGRKAEGKVLQKEFSDDNDVFLLDIAPAYQLKELKKLTREFNFSRSASGSLTITDSVELAPAGTFETALATYEVWEKVKLRQPRPSTNGGIMASTGSDDKNGRIELIIGDVKVIIRATSEGKAIPLEFSAVEIDEDSTTKKKPTRFGFKIAQPITEAVIQTSILSMIVTP